MTICNDGRRTTATRGGRTGGQTRRGDGRTGEKTGIIGGGTGDQGGQRAIARPTSTIVTQVGDHDRNQGNIRSQNDNPADDSIHEDDRNVNVGNSRNWCPYKDFVALLDINGYGDNQKVKYSAGLLTDRALTWWNSEVRTRGREAAVGMTWKILRH
nr:reverse transcriptase domain-containing protein [Tanacetum cinerariifolium]